MVVMMNENQYYLSNSLVPKSHLCPPVQVLGILTWGIKSYYQVERMIQRSYSRSTTFTHCVRVKMIAGNTRDNMYRAEGGGGCQENGGTCSDSHSLMYHRRNISCASNKFTYKFGQTVHQCLTASWRSPALALVGKLLKSLWGPLDNGYSQTRVTTTEPLSLG